MLILRYAICILWLGICYPQPRGSSAIMGVNEFIFQGTHGTGKTGKMAKKNPCHGKHREFGNFAKTQGIWFAQVVNSLIKSAKSVLCM